MRARSRMTDAFRLGDTSPPRRKLRHGTHPGHIGVKARGRLLSCIGRASPLTTASRRPYRARGFFRHLLT